MCRPALCVTSGQQHLFRAGASVFSSDLSGSTESQSGPCHCAHLSWGHEEVTELSLRLPRWRNGQKRCCSEAGKCSADSPKHGGLSHPPRVGSHQRDGEAGEEDGAQEEGLAPPHVRQSAYQRGAQERQQALWEGEKQRSDLDVAPMTDRQCLIPK